MKALLLIPLLCLSAALAAESNKPPSRPGLEITAKFAEFRLNEKTAYYSNDVVVVDPPAKPGDEPTIIRCRELTARRGASGKLESIVAFHNVEIDQGDTHARGQQAVYTATNELMLLSGPYPPFELPILFSSQGTNTGTEIVYNRLTDKLWITNVSTYIQGATLSNAEKGKTNSTGRTNKLTAPKTPAPVGAK